jgi:hypothetical protein
MRKKKKERGKRKRMLIKSMKIKSKWATKFNKSP